VLRRPLPQRACAILIAFISCLVTLPCGAAPAGEGDAHTRTLYLIRHGAYAHDADADPRLDPGISPLGVAQARLVAARLVTVPVRFDSLASSTMNRAIDTAMVIHQIFPNLPMTRTALIEECTPPTTRTAGHPSGEEQSACVRRLDAAYADMFRPARQAEVHDIVVAHANVIRYLVTKALGVDTRAWIGMSLAHASLTIVRIQPDGKARVLAVGDIGHVPPNLQSWGGGSDPELVVPGGWAPHPEGTASTSGGDDSAPESLPHQAGARQ
jgi:serine/threonine-protein phosphatase PGAM5